MSDGKAMRVLFFAAYYLSQRSFDSRGWHDRGDHEAYRLLRDRMDTLTSETVGRVQESVRGLRSI